MFEKLLIKRDKFTLIELIVVIGILAILASLVLPNIKGIEGEAKGVALATERKSVQTAVEMYKVDNIDDPILDGEVINIGQPGIINMNKLYPTYLRDFPSTKEAKYWLDYTGKVWVSLADAPTGITNTNGDLSWNAVPGAVEYIIYKYSVKNSSTKYNLKEIAQVSETSYSGLEATGKYLVQSVDNKNNKSASVNGEYTGYKNQKPILDFKLLNSGELTNETLLEFDWSNSFDPDGDEIFVHKIIVNSSEVQNFPEHLETGEHIIQLSLIDSKSYVSDLKELNITVVEANKPPIAVLKLTNTEEVINDSTLLNFDWSESNDPNNDMLVINEIKLDGVSINDFPEYLEAGEHTIKFNVKDNKGLVSNTVILTINVLESITQYTRTITVDSAKIDENLVNYPIMVKLDNSNFDFSKVRDDGYDIAFYDMQDNLLNFEVDYFNKLEEKAIYYVKIPEVSNSINTEFKLIYGNAQEVNDRSNRLNVWDENYVMVQHMNELLKDSTIHINDGINNGSTTIKTFDGKGQNFNGESDIEFPNSAIPSGKYITIDIMVSSKGDDSNSIFNAMRNDGIYRVIGAHLPHSGDTVYWDAGPGGSVVYDRIYQYISDDEHIDMNLWTFRKNVDAGTMSVFKNGILWHSGTGLTQEIGIATENLIVGAHLNGTINEMRISNVARSDNWIKTDHSNIFANDLVAIGIEE